MLASTIARGARHIALLTFALAALTACKLDSSTSTITDSTSSSADAPSSATSTVLSPGSTGGSGGLLGGIMVGSSPSTASQFTFAGNTFQTYSVPKDGWYFLDVRGAQGGAASNGSHRGGFGARMQGYVQLKAGDSLRIAVGGMGQVGSNVGNNVAGGGGGGGTSIVKANGSNYEPLLIAGGGGGGAANYDGSPGLAGRNGGFDNGGTNGNGGGGGGFSYGGAGGAGYYTDGGTQYDGSTLLAYGGQAYLSGNYGGNARSTSVAANGGAGGWGGGGQGGPARDGFLWGNRDGGGGGGGGYSGGAGGPTEKNGGAGGGSFVADAVNTILSLAQQDANSGDGAASIQAVTDLPTVQELTLQTATIGQAVTLGPVYTDASGKTTYQWMKDGALLPGQTGATLSLAAFKFTDSGVYQVVLHKADQGTYITRPAFLSATSGAALGVWGDNRIGQLGLGDKNTRVAPTQVPGFSDVVAATSGSSGALMVKRDGTLWGMGSNSWGELSLGNTDSVLTPTRVPNVSDVVAVGAGTSFSLFVKRDGTLWGLGSNTDGQLGLGDTRSVSTPTQVPNGSDVVAVATGMSHSLFVKRDGTLWVMGYNENGELGLGDSGLGNRHRTPTQVPGVSDAVAVAAAGEVSFVVKRDGTLWAMGYNDSGVLGFGNADDRHTPTQVPNVSDVVAVSAGVCFTGACGTHAMFAKSDGTLWVMGDNKFGQLGLGDTDTRRIPTQVRGVSNVVAVVASEGRSFFLKRDGTLWGMGGNDLGELGTSSRPQLSPVQLFFRDANNNATAPVSVASLPKSLQGYALLVLMQAP